jgi:hypothetical protein
MCALIAFTIHMCCQLSLSVSIDVCMLPHKDEVTTLKMYTAMKT